MMSSTASIFDSIEKSKHFIVSCWSGKGYCWISLYEWNAEWMRVTGDGDLHSLVWIADCEFGNLIEWNVIQKREWDGCQLHSMPFTRYKSEKNKKNILEIASNPRKRNYFAVRILLKSLFSCLMQAFVFSIFCSFFVVACISSVTMKLYTKSMLYECELYSVSHEPWFNIDGRLQFRMFRFWLSNSAVLPCAQFSVLSRHLWQSKTFELYEFNFNFPKPAMMNSAVFDSVAQLI